MTEVEVRRAAREFFAKEWRWNHNGGGWNLVHDFSGGGSMFCTPLTNLVRRDWLIHYMRRFPGHPMRYW